jgi:hypothetical protein
MNRTYSATTLKPESHLVRSRIENLNHDTIPTDGLAHDQILKLVSINSQLMTYDKILFDFKILT